jgi:branched-subunit amino acid ABC-type transport system permease component
VPSWIAVSTASIFAPIALGFSIRLGLLQLAYLTRGDIFVVGATLLVFLGMGIVIVGSRMTLREREAVANPLNAAMRGSILPHCACRRIRLAAGEWPVCNALEQIDLA